MNPTKQHFGIHLPNREVLLFVRKQERIDGTSLHLPASLWNPLHHLCSFTIIPHKQTQIFSLLPQQPPAWQYRFAINR